METKFNRPFNFFSDYIPYYRQLRPITDSALTSILVSRLEFWFERKPEGFFKFFEPCPGHKFYKKDDSWQEELSFSLDEFNTAFEKVGVSYNSKKEYELAENKFIKIVKTPRYEIEKIFDTKKQKHIVKKRVVGYDQNEVETYYCRYHDRMQNYNQYFRNPNKSILADAEALVEGESRSTVKGDSPSTVKGKSRLQCEGKSVLRKTENPNYSYLYTGEDHKKTHESNIAPKNGASKNIAAQIKSSEPNNFEKLIDWWYKCKGEENPGLEPPRYKGKRFTEVVTDRLSENRTWEQIHAAIKVYWEIVKSPAHYYDSRGDITWFIAMGIDRFWSPKDAMEFFKIKNKNGTNGKTEHRVTPAPDNLYFKSPGKKQVSAEARAAENVELMATIKSIKSKFDKVNTDAEISV